MKIVWRLFFLLVLLSCAPVEASRRGGAANGSTPSTCQTLPCSYWAGFSGSAYYANINVIPLLIWLQDPTDTSHYAGGQATLAKQFVADGGNTFIGLYGGGGNGWPEGTNTDSGEMAAIKAANAYVIGGYAIQYSGTGASTVTSALGVASAQGAQANLIGWNIGDEPACATAGVGPILGSVPTFATGIAGVDSTRFTTDNMGAFIAVEASWPNYSGCHSSVTTALGAIGPSSYDLYPAINPYYQGTYAGTGFCGSGAHVELSDFITKPNDCLWFQAVGVANLVSYTPTHPVWAFVDVMNDALGFSGGDTRLAAQTTSGTKTLTNLSCSVNINSACVKFTSAWVGMNVTATGCVPANDVIDAVVDQNTITLHTNATASCSTTGGGANIFSVAGGTADNVCVVANNLCVTQGNEYRMTAPQLSAEVWLSIVAGATGIQWFCDDNTSLSFCMGDSAGGSAATAAHAEMIYLNGILTTYAPEINQVPDGMCQMQSLTVIGTLNSSCTNGILTMATGTAACPGLARVDPYNGAEYVIAITGRASTSATNCGASAGATFTFTLTGKTGTATVVYDSNSRYDAGHDTTNATHALNGSAQFTDTLGDNGDSYRVKIYKIQ